MHLKSILFIVIYNYYFSCSLLCSG